jgi:uncharacterized UBP type Zn finger protein
VKTCSPLSQKLEHDSYWSGLPLKFINDDNSCYSNVVVTALLYLNYVFIVTVNNTTDNSTTSFKTIFSEYFTLMNDNFKYGLYTRKLRMFVAGFPVNQQSHQYTNDSMQDGFLFLTDLMAKWSEPLRDRFKILHSYRIECMCGKVTTYEGRPSHIVTVRLNAMETRTDYKTNFTNHSQFECDVCKMVRPHMVMDFYEVPFETHYLILYVHNFDGKNQKINSILYNYDSDNMSFPSIREGITDRFVVKSAVVRTGESINHGHFTVWVNNLYNKTWLLIDDEHHTSYEQLPENLPDVQFFILEKFITNIQSPTQK